MSYRLIDANAMVNYKEVNDMPCIYADLPNGLDGGFYDIASKLQNSQSDAPKSEETDGIGASKCDIRDFDDSREKLEADVRKHYSHTTSTLMYPPSANKQTDWLAPMPMDTVFGWLDRQAAITEQECREYEDELRKQHHRRLHATKCAIAKAGGTWTEDGDGTPAVVFVPDVDKLTAERDELKDLQKQVISERNHAISERDELRAECEGLEHANKRQARKIHDVCEANRKLKAKLEKEEQLNSDGWTQAFENANAADENARRHNALLDKYKQLEAERDEWKALAKSYEEDYVGPLREAGFDAHAKGIAGAFEELVARTAELESLVRGFRHCAQQGKCANCEHFAGNDGCGLSLLERYDALDLAGGAAGRPFGTCSTCRHAVELCDGTYDCVGGPLVETWDYYDDQPRQNIVPPDGHCHGWEGKEAE